MKAVMGIVGLLAVLGIVYGLAFAGVIPVKKLARKSPALAKALTALHLVKPEKPKTVVASAAPSAPAASPAQQALDAEKQQLATERAQLDKDKAALAAQKQATPAAPSTDSAATPPDSSAPGTPAPDSGKKLVAMYDKMDADDVAHIFAKLPDPMVVQTLMQMDESHASDIFAALPPDRAARLSQMMTSASHAQAQARSASTPASPTPQTVIQ